MNRTEREEEADIEAIFERDRNKPPRYPLKVPLVEVIEIIEEVVSNE